MRDKITGLWLLIVLFPFMLKVVFVEPVRYWWKWRHEDVR
jgi:hypothetical protein